MTSPLRQASVAVGTTLARQLFERRGNHSETHLSEAELAALLALAVERYAAGDYLHPSGEVR